MKDIESRWWEIIKRWNLQENGRAIAPGRNDGPAALYDMFEEGWFGRADNTQDNNGWRGIDLDLLAYAVTDAWSGCEFPARAVDTWHWEWWLSGTGFIENGRRVGRPTDLPATFYRAALLLDEDGDGRLTVRPGLSWTDLPETALWFYDRNVDRREWYGGEPVLLRVENVPSEDVLAHIHGEHQRDESEWLIRSDLEDDLTWTERVDVETFRQTTRTTYPRHTTEVAAS